MICRLTGRATVEFTIAKVDGSTFSPDAGGELRKTATIQVCCTSNCLKEIFEASLSDSVGCSKLEYLMLNQLVLSSV